MNAVISCCHTELCHCSDCQTVITVCCSVLLQHDDDAFVSLFLREIDVLLLRKCGGFFVFLHVLLASDVHVVYLYVGAV